MINWRKLTVITTLSCYLVWNLIFIVQGEIPPSFFKYVTKLPCPSSGGIRSLRSLIQGNIRESLLYNPFTLVYIFLILLSGILMAKSIIEKKKLLLPQWIFYAWIALLGISWITKFILPSQYW